MVSYHSKTKVTTKTGANNKIQLILIYIYTHIYARKEKKKVFLEGFVCLFPGINPFQIP